MIVLPEGYSYNKKNQRGFIGADWEVRVRWFDKNMGMFLSAFDIAKQSVYTTEQFEPKVRYAGKLCDGSGKWIVYPTVEQLVLSMVTKHRMLRR